MIELVASAAAVLFLDQWSKRMVEVHLSGVGCSFEGRLENPVPPILTAVPGNARVDLSWTAEESAEKFHIKRKVAGGVYATVAEVSASPNTDPTVTNGTTYVYVVTAWEEDRESDPSNEAMVTPTQFTEFVTSKTLGTPRNAFTAWLGMAISVGPSPLTIATLGRAFAPGNSQIHVVKIVDAATGADLPGGSVTVNMAGGSVAGDFVYASLSSPVTLNANASYYVVSQETLGQDQFHDNDTAIQTTSVAIATSSIFGDGSSYLADGPAGQTYGPVDFQY